MKTLKLNFELASKLSTMILVSAMSAAMISTKANAADFALQAGFRSQSGTSATGTTAKSQTAFQLGGIGTFDLSGPLAVRSGFEYVQRNVNFTNDSTSAETATKLNYFDIPVGLMYKFDYGGVYAGVALGMNLDSSASGGGVNKLTDVQSMIVPVQIGATFKFAPQLGANIFFETIGGNVAKDLSSYKAVGANLVIFWD